MPLYRKKPVVIEAVQFTDDLARRCLLDREPFPFGVTVGVCGDYHPARREVYRAWITIRTLEGVMRAEIGDWIIKGVAGEVYPCKDDIFKLTYEPAAPGGDKP